MTRPLTLKEMEQQLLQSQSQLIAQRKLAAKHELTIKQLIAVVNDNQRELAAINKQGVSAGTVKLQMMAIAELAAKNKQLEAAAFTGLTSHAHPASFKTVTSYAPKIPSNRRKITFPPPRPAAAASADAAEATAEEQYNAALKQFEETGLQ